MLLQRIADGDASAIEECLDFYGSLVWSIARRWSSSKEDAEDAVQEIMLDVWKSAHHYDSDASSESTFISMVARRRLIDRRRRASVRPHLRSGESIDFLPGSGRSFIDEVELNDEAQVAAGYLAQLRDQEREVLRLAIHDGLTHQQIANCTGLPLGTVKSNIRRALVTLKDLLARETTLNHGGGWR